jgi:hypothetical protein
MTKFFLVILLVAGCAGCVPGRQAYWDTQVRKMCRKDGGVQIFERVRITKSEINFLGESSGKLVILSKELAHPQSPVYAIRREGKIFASEGNVSIGKSEWSIIRRLDKKVVANLIRYSRTGGDSPGFIHQSTFFCPDSEVMSSDIQKLFIIEENSK